MKNRSIIAFLMMACLLAVLLCGCSQGSLVGNTELAEEMTRTFIDNVLTKKYDEAFALIKNAGSREAFKKVTDYMDAELEGVSSYELKVISWNSTLNDGVTKTTVSFEMKTDTGKKFEVSTVLMSNIEGMAGFHIKPVPKITDTVSLFKIPLIILSVVVVVFQMWMLVDCIRNKTKLKILWIIMIVFSIRLSLTLGADGLNFMPSIFLGLSLSGVAVTGATFTAQITLPIGAIVYLIMRKKLHTPIAPPPAPEQTVTNTYGGYYSPVNVGQQTEQPKGAEQVTTDETSEEASAESGTEDVTEENKPE